MSERFAGIIADLRRAVAAHSSKHHALVPLMVLFWSRLGRMDARLQALVALVRAGVLSPPSRPTARPAASRPQTASAPRRFPQGFAWLVRLMPEAAVYGSQLQHLLTDPDMPALLAAEPRLGRILRPLLHMLAVRPGPDLALPPRAIVAPCGTETATGTSSPPPRPPRRPRPRPPLRPNGPRPRARRPTDPWQPSPPPNPSAARLAKA